IRRSTQPERALAQRDGGVEADPGAVGVAERPVEAGVADQGTGIGSLEAGQVRQALAVGDLDGDLDEPLADVDAEHRDAAPGQRQGVPSRSAADIEHPHAQFQAEEVDQEADILLGAHGERVAEVGRSDVIGDVLEPVPIRLAGRSGGLGSDHRAQPLAAAQLEPCERLTARGTDRSKAPDMAWVTTSTASSSSPSGTSTSTSSCTWRISRLPRPRSSIARSRRTSATLKMSAARPWIGAFMAWRSPAMRTLRWPELNSGMRRRRPDR